MTSTMGVSASGSASRYLLLGSTTFSLLAFASASMTAGSYHERHGGLPVPVTSETARAGAGWWWWVVWVCTTVGFGLFFAGGVCLTMVVAV